MEAWASKHSKLDAAGQLMAAGVAAGPCQDAAEVTGEYTAAQANNDCSSDKDNTIVWTTGS